MEKKPAPPHMPWMDLWQYSSELPLVLAWPVAPFLTGTLPDPTAWSKLLNSYAEVPTALAASLVPKKSEE
ncbi:MAG: hypothetical protein JNJ44_05115 [Zoogloeaceae bacterium]|nr:hypothetical protein [Zoogloeaceae bacterium]